MGSSAQAYLAYGYDLGSQESTWNFEMEKGQTLPVLAAQLKSSEFLGLLDELELYLVMYCSYDYPGFILASKVFHADDWSSIEVSPDLDHSATGRLDKALELLRIRPNNPDPSWILAPFYG